jgi:putative phosphoribosyl transferase
LFTDRHDAGRRLAERLRGLRALRGLCGQDLVVLGLPRGGIPVAAEVAAALGAPLDVTVVRKLGVPYQPELGMGAIGEGGVRVLNEEVLRVARVSQGQLRQVEERERAELERRAGRYRAGRPPMDLQGRTVVVVDDGIATGSTARAACLFAHGRGAARVVLAVPVAPVGWTERLTDTADELVALATPRDFYGVGQFYQDFTQTTDEEVVACLQRGARPAGGAEAQVRAGGVRLGGQLTVPDSALGAVVFAHGSGSGRHSPRNRFVASMLNRAGLATLLLDLLTEVEAADQANVFDTLLLARRLSEATRWLREQRATERLPVGYFGASTGAAAALWAAAEPDARIGAMVSRGGRPDLAGPRLAQVTAPTLLIVGGLDDVVLDLNRHAQAQLHCENRLAVVPGATHLFEEPGTLETAAELARDWFVDHLASLAQPAGGRTGRR